MNSFNEKLAKTWLLLALIGQLLAWMLGWPQVGFALITLVAGASLFLTVWGLKVLFRSDAPALQKTLKVAMILFFKLVCLGILAITLKRFHDFTALALLTGTSLYWAVPIIAGLVSSKESYARK